MKNPTASLVVTLLALGAGYALGAGRSASREAAAEPPAPADVKTHITSDPGGTTLVVWTLKNGEVASARSTMLLDDRTIDAKGLHVTNPRLVSTTYALPSVDTPK